MVKRIITAALVGALLAGTPAAAYHEIQEAEKTEQTVVGQQIPVQPDLVTSGMDFERLSATMVGIPDNIYVHSIHPLSFSLNDLSAIRNTLFGLRSFLDGCFIGDEAVVDAMVIAPTEQSAHMLVGKQIDDGINDVIYTNFIEGIEYDILSGADVFSELVNLSGADVFSELVKDSIQDRGISSLEEMATRGPTLYVPVEVGIPCHLEYKEKRELRQAHPSLFPLYQSVIEGHNIRFVSKPEQILGNQLNVDFVLDVRDFIGEYRERPGGVSGRISDPTIGKCIVPRMTVRIKDKEGNVLEEETLVRDSVIGFPFHPDSEIVDSYEIVAYKAMLSEINYFVKNESTRFKDMLEKAFENRELIIS